MGEEDKRGMLNYITPEMIVKAAGLVKQGKVYALGEELHNDVPRIITPTRIGIQIIQERDGYDRTAGRLGSSTRSAVRVRPVSPSCIPIRARIWTPFPMSTGKIVYNNAPPRDRMARCMAMRRVSSLWSGVGSCSMSPSTRAQIPAQWVLDLSGRSSEYRQSAEGGDTEGRYSTGSDGLAEDVGRARPGRAG